MPERSIAGLKLSADKLPAAQSVPLFLRTSKTMAPGSGLLEAIMMDAEAIDLIPQFFAFVGQSDTDDLTKLIFDLARCCRLDGKPFDPIAEEVELPAVLAAAWFALEVNFIDFLLASRPAADQSEMPADVAA